jgi:hypothetical protein
MVHTVQPGIVGFVRHRILAIVAVWDRWLNQGYRVSDGKRGFKDRVFVRDRGCGQLQVGVTMNKGRILCIGATKED